MDLAGLHSFGDMYCNALNPVYKQFRSLRPLLIENDSYVCYPILSSEMIHKLNCLMKGQLSLFWPTCCTGAMVAISLSIAFSASTNRMLYS